MTEALPGHRENVPFVDELRALRPGQWLALTDTAYNGKNELIGGRVIADAASVNALDQLILTRGENLLVLPPRTFAEEFEHWYGGCATYAERRALFDILVGNVHHPATQAAMSAIAIARAAIFREMPNAYPYMVLNRFVPKLYRSLNFARALLLVGADDENKSRGHFQELWQAYNRANEHGDEVAATQLTVTVPGVGSTDVDILTEDGRWLEIKRYRGALSLDKKLETKLNVLAEALRRNIAIPVDGREIIVRRIELHALKTVTRPAKRYAQERGIAVYEYSVYRLRSTGD
jgi:hypothetical protein